ncbi:hypothetical protein L9F63_007489, partial [Diploptera punctata]
GIKPNGRESNPGRRSGRFSRSATLALKLFPSARAQLTWMLKRLFLTISIPGRPAKRWIDKISQGRKYILM